MITPSELSAWREACEKATPGPWENRAYIELKEGLISGFVSRGPTVQDRDQCENDAAFIALACNNFLRLLDEIERLQDALERRG